MKTTRRIIALILLAIISLTLTGCDVISSILPVIGGDKTSSDVVTTTTEVAATTQAPTTVNQTTAKPTTEAVVTTTVKEEQKAISVSEAVAIAKSAGTEGTTDKYLVKGTVSKITNYTYGEMYISDGQSELYIYGTRSADGETYFDSLTDAPSVGDTIVVLGILKTYNDIQEMGVGWIQSIEHAEPTYDLTEYTEATIKQARDSEIGSKLLIKGQVAAIVLGQKYAKQGFIITDSEVAIYVFSAEGASKVSVGQQVTVIGEKASYISSKESDAAAMFGYKGCAQIENATVVEKGEVSDLNLSKVESVTIKNILSTDFSENITTNLYKANAIISKSENTGYTNYYIDDLDGKTGSYVYTANNGSDFAWLDEFEGKVCTVYFSVFNAKCATSGCVWRLIPVAVVDENYKFDVAYAGEFIFDYIVKDQLDASYAGDPSLELISSYTNELLGLENIAISYASSDNDIVTIANEEGKLIFHTATKKGEATITVTITVGETIYNNTIKVVSEAAQEIESSTVKAAIDAEDGTELTVKGIVASSLTNQKGFIIADETGAICVKLDADSCKTIVVGDEVVITGKRNHQGIDDATGKPGQSIIDGAVIVQNLHGSNTIPSNSFLADKTVDELSKFDYKTDFTTQVYTMNVKITAPSGIEATTCVITDAENPGNTMTVYCGNYSQVSWIYAAACNADGTSKGVVQINVMLCNWNKKTSYKLIIMSVTVDGQTVYNTSNF